MDPQRVTATVTGGTQQNDESLGILCEHHGLAIRSPNGYNQPMHIKLQDQGLKES